MTEDFKSILLGKAKDMSETELAQIVSEAKKEITNRKISRAKDGDVIIKITDFTHPKVKPFANHTYRAIADEQLYEHDGRAIYDIWNENNNNQVPINGGALSDLFGKNDARRKRFANKKLGDTTTITHFDKDYTIRFLWYELPIPRCDLNKWADELGKKPEDILMGTLEEVIKPSFPRVESEEEEEKNLLMEKMRLEIERLEIENRERKLKLAKEEAELVKQIKQTKVNK